LKKKAVDDVLVRNITGYLSGPLFQATASGGGNLTMNEPLKSKIIKYVPAIQRFF